MDYPPLRRHDFFNISNFRDVGGYAAGPKHMIRWGVFFRSAHLHEATPPEIEQIKRLGVRTVVDLRMPDEVRVQPDACAKDPELEHWHISLMHGLPLDASALSQYAERPPDMAELYNMMLRYGMSEFRRLFMLFADTVPRGAVLFHCSAGKDRTGLAAMFLQAICGVDKLDILSHYQVSRTLIEPLYPQDNTGSDPKNMARTMQFLQEQYGGPLGYLKEAGVSEGMLAVIRRSFLTEYSV